LNRLLATGASCSKATRRPQVAMLVESSSKMHEHSPRWRGRKPGLPTLALRIPMTPQPEIYSAKLTAARTRRRVQMLQNESYGAAVQEMAGEQRIYTLGSKMAPQWSSVVSLWTLMNGMNSIGPCKKM